MASTATSGTSGSLRILHIISGLERGGAEAVLYRLLTAASNNRHEVISMTGDGVYGPLIRDLDIPVHTLDIPKGRLTREGLKRLWHLIKVLKPDAVQTWMYHADLVGGLIARIAGVRAVCWGIHSLRLDSGASHRSARLASRLCALVSGWVPAAIIICSQKAAEAHRQRGYDGSKLVFIPNGYDTVQFSPQLAVRETLRSEFGVSPQLALLGAVARWDPLKDHANLLAALGLLAQQGTDFRCVLAGAGMDRSNEALWTLITQNGLERKIILLGPRGDIPGIMNALDLHILSSNAEAFPNVVCEAMACGTPCVVTDVGDASMITRETGWVVPPRNPEALARGIEDALTEIQSPKRREISEACRQRIVESFDAGQMVKSYEDVWLMCAAR